MNHTDRFYGKKAKDTFNIAIEVNSIEVKEGVDEENIIKERRGNELNIFQEMQSK